jgi:predicted cupin superfamily sugar epimerase/quercetin dioxygenase-like cupin family protein
MAAHSQGLEPEGVAGKLVSHYHMQRVPDEGPWFALTYSSGDELDGLDLPARYDGRRRAAGSAIVVVETPREFSAMHRLQTDEVWHFYEGAPIDMLLLYPDGHGRRITLGSRVFAGELRQFTVPHGVWQGSVPRGKSPGTYSFAADQLSPGFDRADFEMGYRDVLQREYPRFARDIEGLTRAEFAQAPAGQTRTPPPKRAAVVIAADTVRVQRVSPGVDLQELVGQQAEKSRSARLSIARFTLAPGTSTGMSFNHRSQEVFLVTGGSGQVRLEAEVVAVGPGSVVFIPAQDAHAIEAGPANALTFFAVSAPAFTPEDYVPVKP